MAQITHDDLPQRIQDIQALRNLKAATKARFEKSNEARDGERNKPMSPVRLSKYQQGVLEGIERAKWALERMA